MLIVNHVDVVVAAPIDRQAYGQMGVVLKLNFCLCEVVNRRVVKNAGRREEQKKEKRKKDVTFKRYASSPRAFEKLWEADLGG